MWTRIARLTGAAVLGRTRQLVAGDTANEQPGNWTRVAGSSDALSTEYVHHAGVYTAGDRLLAVNRAAAEDQAGVLADGRVTELFKGLNFTRVDDRAGSLSGLIEEIWRPFMVVMMISLLVEAGLCLTRRPKVEAPAVSGFAVADVKKSA